MIAIIPVGVPLSFYYVMGKAKSKLPGGRVSTTLLGGAKLIAQEEDDEDDQFAFLVRDCRPEYWYYEIVTVRLARFEVFIASSIRLCESKTDRPCP